MNATNRRGFLTRIFAGAIAAPAVTKLIENGVAKPVTVSDSVMCYGCSGDMEGLYEVSGVMEGSGRMPSEWARSPFSGIEIPTGRIVSK